MILGIDYHDTLTHSPLFFKKLINIWDDRVYIVTGTPATSENEQEIRNKLINYGIINVTDILMGFNYEKTNMDHSHFERMAAHKESLIKKFNIEVYFDDNPYYVNILKDRGVSVFQTIIGKEYLQKYKTEGDAFFSCHLQEHQFDFLKDIVK